MITTQDAFDRVSDFLANRLSLEMVDGWSVLYLQEAYRSGDKKVLGIARNVRSILNALDYPETESVLRLELAKAVRPFESKKGSALAGDMLGFVSGPLPFTFATYSKDGPPLELFVAL